jgi:hypothetical protein
MIAKVKIAPVEQWCEYYRNNTDMIAAGEKIEIITESCQIDPPSLSLDGHPPGARWWRVTNEQVRQAVAKGGHPNENMICEHMLEID